VARFVRLLLAACALSLSPTITKAQQFGITVTPDKRFSIDGLPVGGLVAPQSRAYKAYRCRPSEDYPGFTRCVRHEKKVLGGEKVDVTTSILHSADGVVAYINQSIKPAHFSVSDIEQELSRLSARFELSPQIKKLTNGPGGLMALVATWNDIELQPLSRNELNILAHGGTPHAGILVDLLGDFHQSARMNFPVYRVAGGKGFVWAASFDQQGTGSLRFFAMDPYLLEAHAPPSPPIASAQPREPAPESPTQAPEARVSTGTGFFVSTDGFAVTNAHVVEGCASVQITPNLSRQETASVVARDAANDLALLKTTAKPTAPASLRSGVRVGENVSAFGFPLSGILATGGNFTTGTVAAVAGLGDDTRYMQITAPIQPGNSGGPVLDQDGNVVGVVVSKLNVLRVAQATDDIAQNVNFAIKASILANFLDANGIRYSLGGVAKEHLQQPDVAIRAKAMAVFIRCSP
jgi:S1-C subfamily serine protease